MSYQYFNVVNKKTLLLNGPKKGEAYIRLWNRALSCPENLPITVCGLAKAGLSEHQPVKLPLMFIKCTTVQLLTSAPLLASRC